MDYKYVAVGIMWIGIIIAFGGYVVIDMLAYYFERRNGKK